MAERIKIKSAAALQLDGPSASPARIRIPAPTAVQVEDDDDYISMSPAEQPEKQDDGAFGAATPAIMGATRGMSMGFADELGAAADAVGNSPLVKKLSNPIGAAYEYLTTKEKSLDEVSAADAETPEAIEERRARTESIVDAYRRTRDQYRASEDAARAQAPKEFLAGELGGSLLVPVPGPGKATGLGKVGKALGTGALTGGIGALGGSRADLTKGEVEDAAVDTGLGAALGVGISGALAGVGSLGGRISSKFKEWAGDRALKAAGGIQKDLGKLSLPDQERVGQALLDEGVVTFGAGKETILDRATEKSMAAAEKIKQLLKQADDAGAEVDKATILAEVQKKIDALKGSPADMGLAAAFKSEAKKIADEMADKLNASEVNKLKGAYDASVHFAKRHQDHEPIANQAKGEIADIFRGQENDTIKKTLPATLSEAFAAAKKQYGNMQAPKDWAEFGLNRDRGNNFIPLTAYITGAGGTGAAASFAANGEWGKAAAAAGVAGLGTLLTKVAKERGDAAAAAMLNEASKLAPSMFGAAGSDAAARMSPVAGRRLLEYFSGKKDDESTDGN